MSRPRAARAPASDRPIRELIPADENKPFDMRELLDALIDDGSFLEIHARWAKEVIVGYARLDGRVRRRRREPAEGQGRRAVRRLLRQGARFIWTCNAFNIPLLFLADVPGFMIGTQVEREGIIRHGAKMISAVSEATVPKISVIVRKAYGAGLYAMAGPAFDPDGCLALPTASIAVMGPSAAINAVYYNQLQAIEDESERARADGGAPRSEYAQDIDILHLASELVIDAVIQPEDLRAELIRRFALAAGKNREWPAKRNPVTRDSDGWASAQKTRRPRRRASARTERWRRAPEARRSPAVSVARCERGAQARFCRGSRWRSQGGGPRSRGTPALAPRPRWGVACSVVSSLATWAHS